MEEHSGKTWRNSNPEDVKQGVILTEAIVFPIASQVFSVRSSRSLYIKALNIGVYELPASSILARRKSKLRLVSAYRKNSISLA